MTLSYPQRHPSHTLENESENHLRSNLPESWIVNKPSSDYGLDLQIEIVENGNVTGLELLIQLKASHKPAGTSGYETFKLKMSTYNYLKGRLGAVMFIKYVKIENEAYWVLLRDITAPNPIFNSFTVKIPKTNRMSSIDWNGIVTEIRTIADCKLMAGREI
ncbi:MAG: DUF4365 domain-containing protein [Blastocatellales bacterium]